MHLKISIFEATFSVIIVILVNKKYPILLQALQLHQPERTKQMEPILRAKVKIFFKSENLKKLSHIQF